MDALVNVALVLCGTVIVVIGIWASVLVYLFNKAMRIVHEEEEVKRGKSNAR